VGEDPEQRLADARERVRELARDLSAGTRDAWRAALGDELAAERDLAAARGEQYAQVIDIGPLWDSGAPLPHLISDGSRAFVACRTGLRHPGWDGTYPAMVSADDERPSLFTVIEIWGCAQVRFGGPNDEAITGHPLYGKGLDAYRAHEVFNSRWIEDAIAVNSVHPYHSDARFRELHHYAFLFHDEMLEALALGAESRLAKGTLREVLLALTGTLIDQPHRPR
jgi:hypothetical protein